MDVFTIFFLKMKKFSIYVMALLIAVQLIGCKESSTTDNVEYPAQIEILYEYTSVSYNDDVIIYVDDAEFGKISVNDKKSFDIYLEVGEHTIYARSDERLKNRSSNKIKFSITETNQTFSLTLSDNSWSGLKLSLNESE